VNQPFTAVENNLLVSVKLILSTEEHRAFGKQKNKKLCWLDCVCGCMSRILHKN